MKPLLIRALLVASFLPCAALADLQSPGDLQKTMSRKALDIKRLLNSKGGAPLTSLEARELNNKLDDLKETMSEYGREKYKGAVTGVNTDWRSVKGATEELSSTPWAKVFKDGKGAVLESVRAEVSKEVKGTVAWVSSGKDFSHGGFDVWKSDYDQTVLGSESGKARELFLQKAPPEFVQKLDMSTMDGNGNLKRYRGNMQIPLTPRQEQQIIQQLKEGIEITGKEGGAFLSHGGHAWVDKAVSKGKYAGDVHIYEGGRKVDTVKLAAAAEVFPDFGLKHAKYGDLIGQANDNLAQLDNYIKRKGFDDAAAKIFKRQMDVFGDLPPDLQKKLSAKYGSPGELLENFKNKRVKPNDLLNMAQDIAKAAGDPSIVKAGTPATQGGKRLMQNLLASIMHMGDKNIDNAIENAKGLYPHLSKDIDDAVAAVGKTWLAEQNVLRQQRLGGGMTEAALKKIDELIEAFKRVSKPLAAKLAPILETLGNAAGKFFDALDVALIVGKLSAGDPIGALLSLGETLSTNVLPGVGMAGLTVVVANLALELTIGRALEGLETQTQERIMKYLTGGDPENPEFLEKLMNTRDLRALIEEAFVDSGFKAGQAWQVYEKQAAKLLTDLAELKGMLRDAKSKRETREKEERERAERRRKKHEQAVRKLADARRKLKAASAGPPLSFRASSNAKAAVGARLDVTVEISGGKGGYTLSGDLKGKSPGGKIVLPYVMPRQAGTYNLWIVVTDSEQRHAQTRLKVEAVPALQAALTGPDKARPGEKVTLTLTLKDGVPTFTARTYLTGVPPPEPEGPTEDTTWTLVTELGHAPGLYEVNAEVTDGVGSTDKATWQIEVVDENAGTPPVDPLAGIKPLGTKSTADGPGASGTFPQEVFNHLQLQYSVTGCTLGAADDSEGFHPTRSYKGKLQGMMLRVKGTAIFDSDYTDSKTYGQFYGTVDVKVAAGDKTDSFRDAQEKGQGPWRKDFLVSVPIPPGEKKGSFSITVTFVNPRFGNRSVTVEGTFGE